MQYYVGRSDLQSRLSLPTVNHACERHARRSRWPVTNTTIDEAIEEALSVGDMLETAPGEGKISGLAMWVAEREDSVAMQGWVRPA